MSGGRSHYNCTSIYLGPRSRGHFFNPLLPPSDSGKQRGTLQPVYGYRIPSKQGNLASNQSIFLCWWHSLNPGPHCPTETTSRQALGRQRETGLYSGKDFISWAWIPTSRKTPARPTKPSTSCTDLSCSFEGKGSKAYQEMLWGAGNSFTHHCIIDHHLHILM